MLAISSSVYANSEIDLPDDTKSLRATSCGHYVLKHRAHFETNRPLGRKDYQLLYVMRGKSHFEIDGQWHTVEEGHIVIYFPDEPQHYYYELCDSPDIYWLHFTGSRAEEILSRLSLLEPRIFPVQIKDIYKSLFDRIIQEFQLKRINYGDIADTCFYELLLTMSRSVSETDGKLSEQNEQVQQAVQLFHNRFQENFSLADYARQCGMSVCWFTRIFHRQMGVSPRQYLTDVRINKAKELLTSSSYNIGEISAVVGYENPLYFSRLFKKHTGFSPSEYRNKYIP